MLAGVPGTTGPREADSRPALGAASSARPRLGHADPAITLRVYAHVIRSAEAAAADIFADAVKAAC
jgi:integrase